jgi:putative ATP-binding cassette transporter
MTFRDGLSSLKATADHAGRIQLGAHPDGKLAFHDLSLAFSDGRAEFETPNIEIARGERVLIVSQPCSDKSKFLRAIAGLWTRGDGKILLPEPGQVMFVPARPYLPLTTLRAAITYPNDAADFTDAAVRGAFERVGLDYLAPRVGDRDRWDKVLSTDEQQSLALARLLLHRPQWVFLEDATALNEELCDLLRSILADELRDAAVVGFATGPALAGLYARTLNLRRRATGAKPRSAEPRKPAALPAVAAA